MQTKWPRRQHGLSHPADGRRDACGVRGAVDALKARITTAGFPRSRRTTTPTSCRTRGITPNFSQSSPAGGAIELGQEYTTIPWWCRMVLIEVGPWRHRIPPEEVYARLRHVQPELERLAESIETEGFCRAREPRRAARRQSSRV